MILASNRVRSDTRAFVDGKKQLAGADQAVLDVGGGLTVSAIDDAGISAEVSMSSNVAGGSGSTVAAGGVFSLNDVRSQVAADAWSLTLTTGGDASITASATAGISAVLSGEVVAASEEAGVAEDGDEAAAEPAADAGSGQAGGGGATAIAANGLIATNRILIDADASLRDSVVTVSGSLGVEAENTATIDAENTASTESSGTAAGVVLAFNTIGWKPQNIFSAAIDTLIGADALGQTDSAQSSAEITNTTLDVGEDLTLTAVTVPQINASIENTVQSSGGVAVGLTLASNLVSADSHVLLTPKNEAGEMELPDDTVFAIGGNVLIKASDTSGIVARIGAATGSEGKAALGAQLVRNDVRSTVKTLVDSAAIEAEGDVTLLARGSASITALLSDQELPELKESEPEDGGAVAEEAAAEEEVVAEEAAAEEQPTSEELIAAEEEASAEEEAAAASMAFKGLIATNSVLSDVRATVLDSDISAGGDLIARARNAANIEAENTAKADADGAAVGVTLAFNTIGWKAQNVLFNALDALLGTSIGDEQPAQILATVSGSNLAAGGDLSVEAEAQEKITATIVNEANASGASVAAGMVLASNLLSARARATVAPALKATEKVNLSAGGSITVSAVDEAGVAADVSMVASSGGAAAVGGLVVRNDVRSDVFAEVDRVQGEAGEDFTVLALESASIEATLSGETKSLEAAADPAADAGEDAVGEPETSRSCHGQ
jgi:hypothetical protein